LDVQQTEREVGWKITFGGEVACEVAGEEDEGMKY